VFGDDDLIFAHDVGQCLRLFGVGAGDAGDGRQGNCSLTAGGGDTPLRAHELANLLADCVHQLVEMDEVVGGLEHGLLDLRERTRAAEEGESADH